MWLFWENSIYNGGSFTLSLTMKYLTELICDELWWVCKCSKCKFHTAWVECLINKYVQDLNYLCIIFNHRDKKLFTIQSGNSSKVFMQMSENWQLCQATFKIITIFFMFVKSRNGFFVNYLNYLFWPIANVALLKKTFHIFASNDIKQFIS